MNKSDSIYKIFLYLKGDSLDPDDVTIRLHTEPTKSHKKGEKWLTSSGKEVMESTGLWALSAPTTKSLSDALDKLSSTLIDNGAVLSELPGLEEAYIDIFIAVDADENGGGTSEFDIDEKSVASLAKLGFPVRFTIAIVSGDIR